MVWREQLDITLPCDKRAESVILNYGQIYPDQIIALGVTPEDFYDPHHRRLWSSMIAVLLQCRDVRAPGTFYLRLIDELRREYDDRHTVNRILESVDATADWITAKTPDEPTRDVGYWISQIKRCAVARNLIDAAAQIAEMACRVPTVDFDVTDASAVLSRVAGIPDEGVIGMELPV